jgi:hypothetical protein
MRGAKFQGAIVAEEGRGLSVKGVCPVASRISRGNWHSLTPALSPLSGGEGAYDQGGGHA